jgi:hypothetical protein
VVECALHDAREPIGVATYEITRTLPKALKDQLPSPKKIAKLLDIRNYWKRLPINE